MDRAKLSELAKIVPDFVSRESRNHKMQHLTPACNKLATLDADAARSRLIFVRAESRR